MELVVLKTHITPPPPSALTPRLVTTIHSGSMVNGRWEQQEVTMPSRHWAFMATITQVNKKPQPSVHVTTRFGEQTKITFHPATTEDREDMQKLQKAIRNAIGHTILVFYAEKITFPRGLEVVRVEHPCDCQVFPQPLNHLIEGAEHYMTMPGEPLDEGADQLMRVAGLSRLGPPRVTGRMYPGGLPPFKW
ncbi:hypothetical protein KIPB_004204 [Kipferlia bialata]|uniref:Uncharacterized protein n=1 Tax=Kipferlia bialata TaxID=797122 RepID=A0A9K3CWM9_9EUKA|nr:hypothetical protein KIPB_004204 [Kipferlia bialata]|eukprot:g4204.t1